MTLARRHRVGVVLLIAVLLVTGCANIPEQSTPHAVRDDKEQPQGSTEEPSPNLNAFDLVREFVHKSGNPEAASMYLTEQARANWERDAMPTLIHDTFGTVPLSPSGKLAGEDQGSADVTVVLRVTKIGRLGGDAAFVPSIGEEEHSVGVRREDGQWRIDKPPPVFVPLTDFDLSYQPVTLYFFDPDLRVTVPDLRYVPASPATGLPARVIQVLLSGPSDTLGRSVKSPLQGVGTRTNVVPDPDGTLVVNLSPLGDKSTEQRELIAAQIVLSLQTVTSSRLRIKGDGQDLIEGHGDWRVSDLKAYDALTKPNPDQPGLITADGRLRTLREGQPISGPAGNGEFHVESAAQSLDGGQLAAVTQTEAGPRLRIGTYGEDMQEIAVDATIMTRPTWLVSTSPEQSSREVWTVADGNVVRVVPTGDETWKPIEVNASELDNFGFGPITQLRLSRDGTRVAVVTGTGRLIVASVVRDNNSVSLSRPRQLQPTMIIAAVGVDWYNQSTLVVATEQATQPVMNVSVDGLKIETYDRNNLQLPVKAVTAAPDRDIVVTDSAAVYAVPGLGQVWRQLPNGQGLGAIPFYPG